MYIYLYPLISTILTILPTMSGDPGAKSRPLWQWKFEAQPNHRQWSKEGPWHRFVGYFLGV